MRDLGSIDLRLHANLEPIDDGDEVVAASVGPDGAAIVLWASPKSAEAMYNSVGQGGVTFPDTQFKTPISCRVRVYSPLPERDVPIKGLNLTFPLIQPLPGDRTLIVGARCNAYLDGPEQNAVVFGANGEWTDEGTLGDGIAEVLTTPAGQIWVSYFDEGVFGNNGWGAPGLIPIGSNGIVRFTPDLVSAWRYPYDAEGGSIDDAYSLNVEGETAWSSYYSDFPIVCIASDVVTSWRGGAHGARSLIVDDGRCALFGGYRADRNRLLVGRLTPEGFIAEAAGVMVLPGGGEVLRRRIVGRGPELHVFVGRVWYKIALSDLLKWFRLSSLH